MHEASLPSINIQLGRSALWWRLTLSAHICAAVFPLFSAGGVWLILLWPFLLYSFFKLARRDFWRKADNSVLGLRCFRGFWRLQNRNGWKPVEFVGEYLVMPLITILKFKESANRKKGRRWVDIIFRDAVQPEPYRQLRVFLLMKAGTK